MKSSGSPSALIAAAKIALKFTTVRRKSLRAEGSPRMKRKRSLQRPESVMVTLSTMEVHSGGLRELHLSAACITEIGTVVSMDIRLDLFDTMVEQTSSWLKVVGADVSSTDFPMRVVSWEARTSLGSTGSLTPKVYPVVPTDDRLCVLVHFRPPPW